MTVKELIEELKKYDSSMLVYQHDSDQGDDELNSVEIKKDEWVWRGSSYTIQDILVLD